jgi:hypothetical protein
VAGRRGGRPVAGRRVVAGSAPEAGAQDLPRGSGLRGAGGNLTFSRRARGTPPGRAEVKKLAFVQELFSDRLYEFHHGVSENRLLIRYPKTASDRDGTFSPWLCC